MMYANDNKPHSKFFDMLTEFGDNKFMRIAIRSINRGCADNVYWFLRFERAMVEWEVNENRSKIRVVK